MLLQHDRMQEKLQLHRLKLNLDLKFPLKHLPFLLWSCLQSQVFGYAKRYDGIANLNTSSDNGETTISIFSALKRNFPMKIDMMEKHPLGSQAFIPMKETTFIVFVAPKEEKLDLNKIEAFTIPPGIGVNYNPGTWHFPLISTEDMNFLVVDRKGSGDNLVIENLDKENITLRY